MAVDAKELLAKNKPLIACYVLAIVPIVLWVLLVLMGVQGGTKQNPPSFNQVSQTLIAKRGKLAELSNRIKGMDPAKPTEKDVLTERHSEVFKKRNEELKEQYSKLYETIKKHDDPLEKWFPRYDEELKKNPKFVPAETSFSSAFTDEIGKLQEGVFKDLVLDPETRASYLYSEAAKKDTVRILQKRFWVQQAVVTALKSGGAERLLETVSFQKPVGTEEDEKTRLISYIACHVVFSASFRDLPKIAKELLAQDIVMRISKLRVELLPFTIKRIEGELGNLDKFVINAAPMTVYTGGLEPPIYTNLVLKDAGAFEREEKWLPEPKLKVTCDLDAYDFEMDRIPSPEAAKAETPPPPSTGGGGTPPNSATGTATPTATPSPK